MLKTSNSYSVTYLCLYLQVGVALPERISEIERLLQELCMYQKQLNDLSLWASNTRTKLESSPDAVNAEVNIQ